MRYSDANGNKDDCKDLESNLITGLHKKQSTHLGTSVFARNEIMRRNLTCGNRRLHLICGFTLLSIAFAVYYIDVHAIALDYFFNLREGSLMAKFWQKPPIKLLKGMYIFNVTNSERFLSGIDKKLHVQEVGPYTYGDSLENTNVTWNDNGTVSFIQHDHLIFSKELSIGDPEKDFVIVPNLALLAITALAYDLPFSVAIALSSLIKYLDTKPFVKVSVKEFLWGYEDPLLNLATNVFPSWIHFEKIGLFDRMMDLGTNVQTISTNVSSAYRIQLYNGSPVLPFLDVEPEKSTRCSQVNDSYEGVLYTRFEQPEKMFIYRKMFCRSVAFEKQEVSIGKEGYRTTSYTLPDNVFNNSNPDAGCFCKENGKCFPDGLTDISRCYFGFPFGLGLPHLKGVDPALYEDRVEGMKYDESKHSSYLKIQTDMGVPLDVRVSIQVNLLTKSSRFVTRVKPFDDMIVPIAWIKVFFLGLSPEMMTLLWLAVKVGYWSQIIAIGIFVCAGCLLLAFSLVGPIRLTSNKRASIVLPKVINLQHEHKLMKAVKDTDTYFEESTMYS